MNVDEAWKEVLVIGYASVGCLSLRITFRCAIEVERKLYATFKIEERLRDLHAADAGEEEKEMSGSPRSSSHSPVDGEETARMTTLEVR